jgi:hypothetical protein
VKTIKKQLKNHKQWQWEQLVDKVESIATHTHWALRQCQENSKKLQEFIDNIIPHYKNCHDKCHSESRCKQNQKYEPYRIVLTSKFPKQLLENALKELVIYKHPEDYILWKDTFYVDSFNNVMNIFTTKKNVSVDDQVKMRSNLAVCHSNENVGREHTSVYHTNNPN